MFECKYITVSNFSVMFLPGLTSSKQLLKCLAQGQYSYSGELAALDPDSNTLPTESLWSKLSA